MTPKRASGAGIIAGTFSTDAASISDQVYQPTRYTAPRVYNIGDRYYAAWKSKPRHEVGKDWQKHPDQFWADKYGTVLWFAEAESQ